MPRLHDESDTTRLGIEKSNDFIIVCLARLYAASSHTSHLQLSDDARGCTCALSHSSEEKFSNTDRFYPVVFSFRFYF